MKELLLDIEETIARHEAITLEHQHNLERLTGLLGVLLDIVSPEQED